MSSIKREKINNSEMREFTTVRDHFKNNHGSVYTDEVNGLYVVYSYGVHFPMWVYDEGSDMWIGNKSKFSVTTSRTQNQSRPDTDAIEMMHTDELIHLIECGGYAGYCSSRCRKDVA